MKKPLSKTRVWLASGVAVVADLLELPVTYLESFHYEFLFLLGQFADVVLDFIVMGILSYLLGFHRLFLPAFFVEAIPEVDLAPSWVAAVAYVVWQRKKEHEEQAQSLPLHSTPDDNALEVVSEPITTRRMSLPPLLAPAEIPAETPPPTDSAVEKRLATLTALLEKNLISQSEHDAKREQILFQM